MHFPLWSLISILHCIILHVADALCESLLLLLFSFSKLYKNYNIKLLDSKTFKHHVCEKQNKFSNKINDLFTERSKLFKHYGSLFICQACPISIKNALFPNTLIRKPTNAPNHQIRFLKLYFD